MTSTDFFSIFTGWRATDSVTIKAFTIISGRFKMSFAISLMGVVSYLGGLLTEHPIIPQFFPL
jgi:hypothetical protein